jgi:hypothetical protein
MLCQPSIAILLLSIAGVIYHLLTGRYQATLWWLLTGIIGTGTFQALCYGNLEPVAWVLMMIPVIIVCFFLAVALFASRMRIDNIMSVPCDRCGFPHRHEDPCQEKKKPKCHNVMCNTGGDTGGGGGDCDNDCDSHHERHRSHHSEHHHRHGSGSGGD